MIYGERNIIWRREGGSGATIGSNNPIYPRPLSALSLSLPSNPPSVLVISDGHAAKFATSVQPLLVWRRSALAALVIS